MVEDPSESSPSSELREALSDAARRIDAIIDSAERVSEEIRTEAESEAGRYLDERRREADQIVDDRARQLIGLTDSLVERMEYMQGEAQSLADGLNQAIGEVRELRASVPHLEAAAEPEAAAESRPADRDEAPRGVGFPASPAALIRAKRMAVSGSSREEIERSLSSEFGLADAGALVDAALGPPRGDDKDSLTAVNSEALLRATRMAVSGSSREEIERALASEFGLAEADALADAVLGPRAADTDSEQPPPDRSDRPRAPGTAINSEALLRATQMAVSGSSREDIERALASEFALSDPRALVDQVLSPGPREL